MSDTPSGFLVVDKPAGPTSHDVVAQARRASGVKRVGHAGTLDPPARGVLVLALGSCTRLIRYVQDLEKEYVAEVRFGIATSTLDAAGDELERAPMPLTEAALAAVLPQFVGVIEQVPPMVSALKVGGRRLYELARRGEEVERQPRQVHIYSLVLEELSGGEYPGARLKVRCSRGTYIRALAADIASALGGRAHVERLCRTRVGPFDLAGAVALDGLGEWRRHLLPPRAGTAGMEVRLVEGSEAEAVRHGRPLAGGAGTGLQAIVDQEGNLLAVYRLQGSVARAEVVLA